MLLQDLKYAVRQLRSAWGFAALAVITLALGIGANTAMFTVVESVLLRPLPYTHAERLVTIGDAAAVIANNSYLNLHDVQQQAKTVQDSALYAFDLSVIEGPTGSVSVVTPRVSANMFSLLGVRPLMGRSFTTEEAATGGAQVMLISEGVWKQRFGGDPHILGRQVKLGGTEHTIVGVMPASFHFPEEDGTANTQDVVWLPLQPSQEMLTDRGDDFVKMMAVMRPGVRVTQVQMELDAIVRRITQANPKDAARLKLLATGYQQALTGQTRPVFLALVAALALVLLIACANVANLLLARCLARRQEFAVRAALGAGRWRMVRQLLSEGAVLSVLGCGLGILLAQLALTGIKLLPAGTIPLSDTIAMRWSVVGTLVVIAAMTTLLSSLLPGLMVARTDPQPALQAGSRGLGARSVSGRLSGWVVAIEVALSTLLLVGTGLLFHTLWNLEHTQLGFDAEHVTTFTAMPADTSGFAGMAVSTDTAHAPASAATSIYGPTLERMRQMPGVRYAAVATSVPLSGVNMHTSFQIVGHKVPEGQSPNARITAASDEYAEALGVPVLRGRMIADSDTASAPAVIVINEALAKADFAGKDPLGQQIDMGGKDTGMLQPLTIVGILGDAADSSVGGKVEPLLVVPYQQIPTTSLYYGVLLKTIVNFAVKTRGPLAIAPEMRTLFAQTAPGYALDNFNTMQDNIDNHIFNQRLGLYLTGSFAGLAIVMVIAGLYGVLAQLVSYRRREIGVRMALGASRESIVRMILRQGGILIGAGLIAGLVLAVFAGRLVASFLYHVEPVDLMTYLGVVVVLLVVGSIASLIPARSASHIEPMEALRED
jgi:putative ABC transport system permease protein